MSHFLEKVLCGTSGPHFLSHRRRGSSFGTMTNLGATLRVGDNFEVLLVGADFLWALLVGVACVVVPLVRVSDAAKPGAQMIDAAVITTARKYGLMRLVSAILKFIKPMAVAALALYW